MNLIKCAQKKIKKLTLTDITLLKTAVCIAGIILGSFIYAFVQQYVWYFVATFIILYSILLCRIFKK